MKKTIVVLLLLGLAGLAHWRLAAVEPVVVRLTTVERGDVASTAANTRAGTIKACQRSRLSPPMGGQVGQLLVDEGDRVQQGQVLLELWNEDQQARVSEARAKLTVARAAVQEACYDAALARRELKRVQGLAARKLIADDSVDSAQTRASISAVSCRKAEAGVEVADAFVELQQSLFAKTRLTAPFAGIIAAVNGEVGEYITPSPPGIPTPPAIDLIADHCLYVSAPIDEVDAAAIALDMPVRISLDAFRGTSFAGRVSRIAPYVQELEKQARTVDVDATFDTLPEDIHLLVGYSADLEIILEQHSEVLRIPTEAISDGNRVLVYNGQDHRLEPRIFTPGISNWTYTEVTSGLTEGEQILRSLDTPGAIAGAKVEPQDDVANPAP